MKRKPSKEFLKLLNIVTTGTNKQKDQLLQILLIEKIKREVRKSYRIKRKKK